MACCYRYSEVGHWALDYSGNETGQSANASLLSYQQVNAVLPVASIYVDRTQCSVLIDPGCSCPIVDAVLPESNSGCLFQ